MCGIVGYAGNNDAIEALYTGLEKLEYRGYDSCGAAITSDNHRDKDGGNAILYWHHLGAPSEVTDIPHAKDDPMWESSCGIAHTRWATHGDVSIKNAHPHHSNNKDIFVVHNGVIENYQEIKNELGLQYTFYSDTDTEVLANLISFNHRKDPDNYIDVIRRSLEGVEGTYGLAIIFKSDPHTIYAARRSSPLVIGVGDGENFLASDTNALPPHIRKVIYLEDENIAKITKGEFSVYELRGRGRVSPSLYEKDKGLHALSTLGEYDSFLHKEIREQPESILDSFRGRFSKDFSSVVLGGISLKEEVKRVLFLGCGTAYHAGLLGKYYVENVAKIPASVEISSEYKYKNNPTEEGTLVVAISQSGETIDTLSAIKEAQNKKLKTIAITNVVMSSIARQVDEGIYQRIGPEISVASTKSFTSQATILFMLSVLLGEKKNISFLDASNYISNLRALPNLASLTLDWAFDTCEKLAKRYSSFNNINFLGRQYQYPIALEAALKLKELAYVNTCAYPSGEMKHGPLASMDKDSLCFLIAPEDNLVNKNITTMRELKARGVKVVLIKQIDRSFPRDCYDEYIKISSAKDYLLPILSVIPLQIFSMYMAKERGYSLDKPRHLAKSVTVE